MARKNKSLFSPELIKAVDNGNDFCKRLMEERMKLDPKGFWLKGKGEKVKFRKWDALDSVRYGVERYNNYKKGTKEMNITSKQPETLEEANDVINNQCERIAELQQRCEVLERVCGTQKCVINAITSSIAHLDNEAKSLYELGVLRNERDMLNY